MKATLAALASVFTLLACGTETKTKKVSYVPQFEELHHVHKAPDVAKEAAKAVVLIRGLGTAFFISDSGLLMTNEHVVGSDNCPQSGCYLTLRLDYQSGEEYKEKDVFFEPIMVDPALDFAVYQITDLDESGKPVSPFTPPHHLSLSSKNAEELVGARIHLIGHPGANLKKVSSGNFLRFTKNWFDHSCFAIGGNSGSPIIGEDGAVIGIHHRSQSDKTFLSRSEFEGTGTATLAAAITRSFNPNQFELTSQKTKNKKSIKTSLRALDASTTVDDIFKNRNLFLAARTHHYSAKGVNSSSVMLEALDQKCDRALAWKNDRAADDFSQAIYRRCFSYQPWLSCQEKRSEKYQVCPSNKKAIQDRMNAAADKIIELNQESPVWSLVRGEYALKEWHSEGMGAAIEAIDRLVSKHNLKLDYRTASARIWYSRSTDDLSFLGKNLVEYVKYGARDPESSQDASWVGDAALGLYRAFDSLISKQEMMDIFSSLLNRSDVPLGEWLEVEAMAYRYDLID